MADIEGGFAFVDAGSAMPPSMPSAGSFNVGDATDVEQSHVLVSAQSGALTVQGMRRTMRKRTVVVEQEEDSVFGKYLDGDK